MDKTLIHEVYFSNRNDKNLEIPLKSLKEEGLELLRNFILNL